VTQPPAAEPTAPAAPDDEDEELPHCKCGTTRSSKFAVVNRDYSFTGLLYLLWGGTSIPNKVSFRCVKCGDLFETSTSPRVCKAHVI
jgi:hypothetical protein